LSIDVSLLIVLGLTALCAGFIDSVVGGGGLVQIPAVFSILPREAPAALFCAAKIASLSGTSYAAWRYARRVSMPWRIIVPAALATFPFAYLGAMAVAWLPRELLRPMILALLIVAAVYTFRYKEFGTVHQPRLSGTREWVSAAIVGGVLGFYEGFFGPGSGSFLIFLFIRVFGLDFLHASAVAKLINAMANLAAIAYFVPHGHLLPLAAVVMAVGNITGSSIGTGMALRHGSGFVRRMFLCVVGALIVKFAWDTF
jgi:uncharacterized membrane protein YfcA